MANDSHRPAGSGVVQRQVKLPLSKAVEIAYKNIRMRLSRSLLVTSGIVLALAFLMYILADEAMTQGMRHWVATATTEQSTHFHELGEERRELEQQIRPMAAQLHGAAIEGGGVPAEAPEFDPKAHFGRDFAELQREVGMLPASAGDLEAAFRRNPELIPVMQQWIDTNRRLLQVRAELTGPQQLEAMMRARGVPTTPEEIANDRIQTRWLLGLALLVAFVGILNAMLMSVTERFREIGTMKCLGALDSFIIKLFLIESVFQGVIGTAIGIGLGMVLAVVGTRAAFGEYAFMNFPGGALLISGLICLGVGIGLTVAGAVYPAWQAARMQPIEAMRVEA
jgi:predicted outer membrane lipoprotein